MHQAALLVWFHIRTRLRERYRKTAAQVEIEVAEDFRTAADCVVRPEEPLP
jgi:hypothetical protein